MAVEDVRMGENSPGEKSPTGREIPTFEISTPAPRGQDIDLMEDENPSRNYEL